jgi:hypothetical protein
MNERVATTPDADDRLRRVVMIVQVSVWGLIGAQRKGGRRRGRTL